MDWPALSLSLQLAVATLAVLIPLAVVLGRFLAVHRFRGKSVVEAVLALPLVLPPTVLGFYLLVGLGNQSWPGQWYQSLTGRQFVFSFDGLLLASVLVNLPFAVQPVQRAFEAIHPTIREAAACCGHSFWRMLWRIELPLAWPGVLTATALTFTHTLGEFGVVLMIGGSIPGETRTLAISIYERVQAFDFTAAGWMSALLLTVSLVTVTIAFLTHRPRHG